MSLFNWFRGVGKRQTSKGPMGKGLKRWRYALRLENLEQRITPAVTDLSTGVPYGTIQAAVTAASAGDTILADPGTYSESVTIDKSVGQVEQARGVSAPAPEAPWPPGNSGTVEVRQLFLFHRHQLFPIEDARRRSPGVPRASF